jgi:hypothetical protein
MTLNYIPCRRIIRRANATVSSNPSAPLSKALARLPAAHTPRGAV